MTREDGPMANRLAASTSPYLLQHADNPVDWWEWGAGGVRRGAAPGRAGPALASATPRATGATSWRTSRSRTTATAALMNERLRQHQGRPRGAARRRRRLHGGDRAGADRARRLADDGVPRPRRRRRSTPAPTSRPSRGTAAVVHAAAARRSPTPGATGATDVLARRGADHRRRSPTRSLPTSWPTGRRTPPTLAPRGRDAGARLRRPARGGFGGAPKFPPSMVLEFLLRHHARTGDDGRPARWPQRHLRGDGARRHLRPARRAASPATRVDADWLVPHFEKMLYDNALLLRVVPALVAGRPAIRSRERVARGDRRLPAARDAHAGGRLRRGARRGQRGRGGAPSTRGPRSSPRCSATTTARGRPRCSASRGRARSSTAPRPCSCARDPDDPSAGAPLRAGCSPRASSGRGRAATTRWSPPGTAWPSRRWPRPARCSGAPTGSRPPWPRPTCWWPCTSARTATTGCAGSRRDGRRDRTRGSWTTTGRGGGLPGAVTRCTGEDEWLASRGPARHRAPALRRRGGRLLRHRRRRRGADPRPQDPSTTPSRPAGPPPRRRCSRRRRSPESSRTATPPSGRSAWSARSGRGTRGRSAGGWRRPRPRSPAP